MVCPTALKPWATPWLDRSRFGPALADTISKRCPPVSRAPVEPYRRLRLLVYILRLSRGLMSAILSSLRRFVLAPIGLSSPVKLSHNADASVVVGDGDQRLIDIVKAECPSLFGPSAFYTPFPILGGGHAATIFAAMADFSRVDVLEYERVLLRAVRGSDDCAR